MMLRIRLVIPALLGFTLVGPALGQQPYIYPTQGQSQEQLNQDHYQCHIWAVQQTGFDPTRPQTANTAQPPQQEAQQGGVLRGAGRGAAVGAVGGAIGGDAGKGAAIGAAAGALIGGFRQRDQRQRQEDERRQYEQQQQAALAQQQSNYYRAFAVCMNGRGYQVR